MGKTRIVVLVLAVGLAVLTAGCGGSNNMDPTAADVQIENQVKAGLAQQLFARTGYRYSTTAVCIASSSDLKSFKCTTTAQNTTNASDFATLIVDVTCQSAATDCIWQQSG